VTVVEGLRATSVSNILNGGNGGGVGRSRQLPSDTRQRLEDLARANTRPISRSVSSAAGKTMAGSVPNLTGLAAQPPKRGQIILEDSAAKLNNNGKTASVPSIAQLQSALPTRRDRDLNLKNGGGIGGSALDVSVVPNLTPEQQQHLPTSLSSDPSKKQSDSPPLSSSSSSGFALSAPVIFYTASAADHSPMSTNSTLTTTGAADVNSNVPTAEKSVVTAKEVSAMRKESLAGIIAGMLHKYSARKEVTAHSHKYRTRQDVFSGVLPAQVF